MFFEEALRQRIPGEVRAVANTLPKNPNDVACARQTSPPPCGTSLQSVHISTKSETRHLSPTSSLRAGGRHFRASQASPVGFPSMHTLAGSGGPRCKLPYAESQLRSYQRFLRAELRKTLSTFSMQAQSNRRKLSFSKISPHRCYIMSRIYFLGYFLLYTSSSVRAAVAGRSLAHWFSTAASAL